MATHVLLGGRGLGVKLQVHTDSAAGLGACNRLGLGKSRRANTLLVDPRKASQQTVQTFQYGHQAEHSKRADQILCCGMC